MFENPFSPKGRISRTEFWLSCFAYLGLISLFFMTMGKSTTVLVNAIELCFVLFILGPCLWLLGIQAVQRCHDIGKTGWSILNPSHYYQLLFEGGQPFTNTYGEDPRVVRLRAVIPEIDVTDFLANPRRDTGREN